jgi:hypothetical protein
MFSLIREQMISTVDERRLKREVDATLRQGNQTRARRAAQETGSALPGPGQPEQSCLVLLEHWNWGLPHFASGCPFVESLACAMPLEPAPIGEGAFCVSTKGIILSSVSAEQWFCRFLSVRFATRGSP